VVPLLSRFQLCRADADAVRCLYSEESSGSESNTTRPGRKRTTEGQVQLPGVRRPLFKQTGASAMPSGRRQMRWWRSQPVARLIRRSASGQHERLPAMLYGPVTTPHVGDPASAVRLWAANKPFRMPCVVGSIESEGAAGNKGPRLSLSAEHAVPLSSPQLQASTADSGRPTLIRQPRRETWLRRDPRAGPPPTLDKSEADAALWPLAHDVVASSSSAALCFVIWPPPVGLSGFLMS